MSWWPSSSVGPTSHSRGAIRSLGLSGATCRSLGRPSGQEEQGGISRAHSPGCGTAETPLPHRLSCGAPWSTCTPSPGTTSWWPRTMGWRSATMWSHWQPTWCSAWPPTPCCSRGRGGRASGTTKPRLPSSSRGTSSWGAQRRCTSIGRRRRACGTGRLTTSWPLPRS